MTAHPDLRNERLVLHLPVAAHVGRHLNMRTGPELNDHSDCGNTNAEVP